MKLPKKIRQQFAEAGRRGGKKQVPKGFSKMDPARRKEVAQQGGKAKGKKRATRRVITGAGPGPATNP